MIEKIKNTRSHRKFTDKKISKEEILKILEGARYSSSAKNSQFLRYSYTVDDEKCKKLFSAVSLGGLLKLEDKATLEERPRAYILISAKKDVSKKFIKGRHQFTVSGGIDYSIAKDLENSKATFIGGTNEFELKNYNRKNIVSEVIKIDYKNLNGISTSLKYRRSNKDRSIGFNIGYIF